MKDCGSCVHFVKVKNNSSLQGLCELLDTSTKTDCGTRCFFWKGVKYRRKIDKVEVI